MKKILLFMLLTLCLSSSANAQSYERDGKTFTISSTGERKSNNVITTDFKVKESDGKTYTVYCSKSSGACYITKTSRNGKEYRKYLGEDISRQVCSEIGIEYKSRKK